MDASPRGDDAGPALVDEVDAVPFAVRGISSEGGPLIGVDSSRFDTGSAAF